MFWVQTIRAVILTMTELEEVVMGENIEKLKEVRSRIISRIKRGVLHRGVDVLQLLCYEDCKNNN